MKYKTYLDDIQANIIKPHGRNYCTFLFFRFFKGKPRKYYRAFCNELGKIVTSHSQQVCDTRKFKASEKHPSSFYESKIIINTGFSGKGFDSLEAGKTKKPLDGAFKEGMIKGTYRLHDYDLNLEDNYQRRKLDNDRMSHSGISGFISFSADEEERIKGEIDEIKVQPWFTQVVDPTFIFVENGHFHKDSDDEQPGRKGALGFREGLSEVRSYEEAARIGLTRERWHYSEGRVNTEATPYGSYMVFRKIRVVKDTFDSMVEKLSSQLDNTLAKEDREELAAAMFMGRFKDGSPLILTDQPTKNPDDLHNIVSTPFDYSSDRSGRLCPVHSHIRVMNDRRNGPAAAQIIRRGYNYGDDPQNPEGILFVSFQASLVNQFEPLFDHMSAPGLKDPIAYSGTDPSPQHYPVKYGGTKLTPQIEGGGRELSIFQGGEYFYVPSITFLNKIDNW